jgi:hypothetical protein
MLLVRHRNFARSAQPDRFSKRPRALRPILLSKKGATGVPTVATRSRDRPLTTGMYRRGMAAILARREVAPLLSDEHSPLYDTLMKAWTPMKRLQPKTGEAPPDDDPNRRSGPDSPPRITPDRPGADPIPPTILPDCHDCLPPKCLWGRDAPPQILSVPDAAERAKRDTVPALKAA